MTSRLDQMFEMCQELHDGPITAVSGKVMVPPRNPAERFDEVPLLRLIPRGWAAWVLTDVAEAGSSGNFPDDVTLQDIGWALRRLLINAPDAGHPLSDQEETLQQVVNGFREASRWYATGQRPGELARSS